MSGRGRTYAAALGLLATFLLAASPSMAAVDSMVVQPDGKILLLGEVWPQAGALTRLNPDGRLDQGFGQGGFVLDYRLPSFRALALQPNGRIVGAAVGGVRLVRYLPDGSPDPEFAAGGVGGSEEPDQPPFPYFDIGPAAIAVMPDGSMAVAEIHNLSGGSEDARIKRYSADGVFLEVVGRIPSPGPASSASISDLLPQPDGSLVGAGLMYETSKELRSSVLLARFLPGSGSDYDPSFGGGAGLVTPVSEDRSQTSVGFRALAADGDGLVAGGSIRRTFLAARFAKDGTLDQRFGEGGLAELPIHGPGETTELGSSWAEDVAALPGGRILLAGGTSEWGEFVPTKYGPSCIACPQPLLAIVDASGNLDRDFGDGGLLRLPKPDGSVLMGSIEEVVPLSDSKILIKGTVSGSGSIKPPFVARLNPDGSYDSSFGEGGLTVLRFPCTDQPELERGRVQCAARARASLRLTGIRHRHPALSMRLRPNLEWARVDELTLTLPKNLRLTRGFRSKLRVLGASDDFEVHVLRPRYGKPDTTLFFRELGQPRRLRIKFPPGALHVRGRLPNRKLILTMGVEFLDYRWGTWGGHDTVVRRAG